MITVANANTVYTAIYEAISQQEIKTGYLQQMLEQQRLSMADYVYSRLLSGGKLSPQDLAFLEREDASYIVAVASLDKVQDVDVILEQNKPDGDIFTVELYREGYLALICRFKGAADEILTRACMLLENAEMGVSSEEKSLRNLRVCFEEACTKLRE